MQQTNNSNNANNPNNANSAKQNIPPLELPAFLSAHCLGVNQHLADLLGSHASLAHAYQQRRGHSRLGAEKQIETR